MSNLRVTLGIPTMNNQRTIWDTLSAFAEQTVPPDRVHIVDASTDWTPYIAELFRERSDPSFELNIERQTDSTGVGAARARIYDEFEGDILACFDTNGDPCEDWLETHLRTHDQQPVDVVSGVAENRESGLVGSPHDRGFLVQNNSTIKKRALDTVDGWDEQFDRGEDWDMAIRLWRSGAKAYVQNDLGRTSLRDEGMWSRVRTRLGRPSSVRFLRKYGLWYMKFHPVHVLGDAASVVSILAAALALTLVGVVGPPATALLLVPLFGTAAYAGFQTRNRTSGGLQLSYAARRAPEFFLLGYTALREIVYGPRTRWNYGGVE